MVDKQGISLRYKVSTGTWNFSIDGSSRFTFNRELPEVTHALVQHFTFSREGVSLGGISYGAESIGLRTLAAHCSISDIYEKIPLPNIMLICLL